MKKKILSIAILAIVATALVAGSHTKEARKRERARYLERKTEEQKWTNLEKEHPGINEATRRWIEATSSWNSKIKIEHFKKILKIAPKLFYTSKAEKKRFRKQKTHGEKLVESIGRLAGSLAGSGRIKIPSTWASKNIFRRGQLTKEYVELVLLAMGNQYLQTYKRTLKENFVSIFDNFTDRILKAGKNFRKAKRSAGKGAQSGLQDILGLDMRTMRNETKNITALITKTKKALDKLREEIILDVDLVNYIIDGINSKIRWVIELNTRDFKKLKKLRTMR
jgi:hypothetical protein